jgi:hypothetical protein
MGNASKSNSSGKNRKVANTGIKHFVPNKIRLAGQKDYLDMRPCVLIIPVLDLNSVKDWNGGEYKALIMVGEWKNDQTTRRDVCSSIRLLEEGATATPEEIETARELLEQVICGMAYSLLERSKKIEDNLKKEQKKMLLGLRNELINVRVGVTFP